MKIHASFIDQIVIVHCSSAELQRFFTQLDGIAVAFGADGKSTSGKAVIAIDGHLQVSVMVMGGQIMSDVQAHPNVTSGFFKSIFVFFPRFLKVCLIIGIGVLTFL